jgi:glycerol uptake facilitator protein
MTPFIAEIIGTMLMILLGNGVVANVVLTGTKGNNSGWIVITTGWAFAVLLV